MKKIVTILVIAFSLLLLFNACSKDEIANIEPINKNGGVAYRSQLVTVNLTGINLTQKNIMERWEEIQLF